MNPEFVLRLSTLLTVISVVVALITIWASLLSYSLKQLRAAIDCLCKRVRKLEDIHHNQLITREIKRELNETEKP